MTKPTIPETHSPLDDLPGQDFDFSILDFDDEDLSSIIDFDDKELLSVITAEVADVFWISVSGPLELQADALEELKGVMTKFPLIEVELGTERRDR